MKPNCTLTALLIAILAITFQLESKAQSCTSTLNGGTVSASNTLTCPDRNFGLSVTGSTVGTGITYQWQSSPNNVSWTDLPGFVGTGMSTTITTSTYFRRKIMCNVGGFAFSNSVLITVDNFNNCYCTPSISSCASGYTITNLNYTTLNNSSACSPNGYANYTSTVPAPSVMRGTYLPISVTVSAGSASKFVHCFIDFNQNGSFEIKEITLLNFTTGNVYSGFIKLPFNAKTGLTRMRISHGSSGSVGFSPSCFPTFNSKLKTTALISH